MSFLRNAIELPLQTELLTLATKLEETPELAYEETQTVEIWTQFARRYKLRITHGLQGHAPIISFGEFQHARIKIVVTADLDAIQLTKDGPIGHFCGHHAQSVHALGLAAMLAKSTPVLSHDIALRIVGCPAEECRPSYDNNYPLPFIPGKSKLLQEGWFDGATAVLSTHLDNDQPRRQIHLIKGSSGGIWLRTYINARNRRPQWTTFAEETTTTLLSCYKSQFQSIVQSVKTHSTLHYMDIWIETKPNDSAINADLLAAGLIHITSDCLRTDVNLVAKYHPLWHDQILLKQAKRVLRTWDSSVKIEETDSVQGATDLGEVSMQRSTLQIFVGGTTGTTHDPGFKVVDPVFSYLWPVIFLKAMVEEITKLT